MASQDMIATLQKQITANKERVAAITANSDMFFLIVNAMIIYFMQCGFAFLECGAVRAKNATNILLKNILDSFIGAVAYWLFGYAFAFGSGNFFIGWTTWANNDLEAEKFAFWFFHFVFAATAATIVSGALAERCDFAAYLIYSVVITGFVYPVVTHWAWSADGWLLQGIEFTTGNGNETDTVSYQDFAGSGVVHLLGGMAALVGAAILGKRLDRIDDDGKIKQIPGHSVPLAAMGAFILFFGFFAFNGGSQASISQPGDGEAIALSVVNTIISGAFAAISAMVVSRVMSLCRGTPMTWSLLVTVNGGLSGMVAICAGCNAVHNYGAAVIGVIAGVNYLMWSYIVTRVGVDDPLDAVAVHGGSGIWGVLAAPILSKEVGVIYAWNKKSFMALLWNLAGVGAIMGWAVIISLILFGLLRAFKIFRVNPDYERKGLDIPKHGEPAYPTRSYGDGWTLRPMEADTLSVVPDAEDSIPYKEEPVDSSLPYTITSLPEYEQSNGDVSIATTKM